MEYVKARVIDLKAHETLDERWVQDRIAEDPSILGLGDLDLKDKERLQPRAGRLDLLLQDSDIKRRFEVEVQLGKTDPSHIIRTIEYWDIERKRYPQYDHCAVLVAEDITSRFLNVIGLFNGSIPFVAIQMSAIQVGDQVTLTFTRVLDELDRGLDEEDDAASEPTDRAYWEAKATKATVALADKLLKVAREFDPSLELKFNKHYIGLARNGQPCNFVTFRPKKTNLRLEPRLDHSAEVDEKLDAADLDLLDYDSRWRRYRIRLKAADLKKHDELLKDVMKRAFDAYGA